MDEFDSLLAESEQRREERERKIELAARERDFRKRHFWLCDALEGDFCWDDESQALVCDDTGRFDCEKYRDSLLEFVQNCKIMGWGDELAGASQANQDDYSTSVKLARALLRLALAGQKQKLLKKLQDIGSSVGVAEVARNGFAYLVGQFRHEKKPAANAPVTIQVEPSSKEPVAQESFAVIITADGFRMGDKAVALPRQETKLLQYLFEGKRDFYTNDQLRRAWDDPEEVDDSRIKVAVSTVRKALREVLTSKQIKEAVGDAKRRLVVASQFEPRNNDPIPCIRARKSYLWLWNGKLQLG